MSVKHEQRTYKGEERVWVGKYRNSHNLLHWHYDCELLYVERGRIDVFCGGKKYTLGASDAMYIHSGEIHYMQAREETYLLVFIFKDELVKRACGDVRPFSPLIIGSESIPDAYAYIKRELSEKGEYYAQAANARTELLIIDLFRNLPVTGNVHADASVNTLKKLLDDVEENYADYTFEKAAAFAGFSDAYFSRLFHKQLGMTFSQYLNNVRIKHAVAIMRAQPEVSMTELSIKTGFSTIRNFNRMFRSITGYSPRDLPPYFRFEDKYPDCDASGDPTLEDCTLIE